MLGIPDTKSRQKNDIKGILTGNSQSFNSTFEKSIQSSNFKQGAPSTTTNQKHLTSNMTSEDTKMTDKMQSLKAAQARKRHQDSLFNTIGKTHNTSLQN